MKFSLLAVLSATCVAPGVAEVFLKEQFNDDVSDPRCNDFGPNPRCLEPLAAGSGVHDLILQRVNVVLALISSNMTLLRTFYKFIGIMNAGLDKPMDRVVEMEALVGNGNLGSHCW